MIRRGPRFLPLALVVLVAAVVLPGAGWALFAFLKIVLLLRCHIRLLHHNYFQRSDDMLIRRCLAPNPHSVARLQVLRLDRDRVFQVFCSRQHAKYLRRVQ